MHFRPSSYQDSLRFFRENELDHIHGVFHPEDYMEDVSHYWTVCEVPTGLQVDIYDAKTEEPLYSVIIGNTLIEFGRSYRHLLTSMATRLGIKGIFACRF